MYKVFGKVLVKETGVGIPNLLVVLYDIDDGNLFRREGEFLLTSDSAREGADFWQQIPGNRLGSVLTNDQGEFELTYEESDFLPGEQQPRPDLTLFVLAPEEMQDNRVTPTRRLLYWSYDLRLNSGHYESYIIRLPRELLDRFQIPFAAPEIMPVPTVASFAAMLNQSFDLQQGLQEVVQQQLPRQTAAVFQARKRAQEALQDFTLSTYSPEFRATDAYLNPGDKLVDQQVSVIDRTLADVPDKLDKNVTRKLVLHLSEQQIRDLGLTIARDGTISGSADVHRILRHIQQVTSGSELERVGSVLKACLIDQEAKRQVEQTEAKCRPQPEQTGQIALPEGPEGSEQPKITADSLVQEQISRQMAHVTAPEVELKYGIERDGEITATITKPSPADVTSFHDFQVLQIAFEHIWTEAFDDTLMELIKETYAEMVKYKNRVSGVDDLPQVRDVRDMRDLYNDFVSLQNQLERENQTPPSEGLIVSVPPAVKDLIPEISDDDWSRMQSSEHTALMKLGQELADLNSKLLAAKIIAGVSLGTAAQGVVVIERLIDDKRNAARAMLDAARARQNGAPTLATSPGGGVIVGPPAVKRQQGGVIVGPPTGKRQQNPGSANRLRSLMEQLDQRLSEPFKFDIFAPNSLNYGLMITYRQEWVPRDYQVGDLVSTIPLAPKEIRRYSTKRVVKKTVARKEIEDAQSSRRAESSSTSRADSEIVNQARNKTSFQLNAEGKFSVGVFEGRVGTTFGVEAEKNSSSTKKNFREAVVKAAEEYKQQHRLEIDTSLTEELETVSSGEIMNPNHEITVTYPFYELQRQYQVSENIHLLTPVILVANKVPAPDEVDNDWLITYDWILRRAILDDSFLPALDYVTNSVAGDELALETLRTNLQRQADLVDELTKQVQTKTDLAKSAFQELKRLTSTANNIEDVAKLEKVGLAFMFLGPIALTGLAGGGDDEAAKKREEIAKIALERADKETEEVSARLTREVTALQEAIDKYTKALREHFDRQTAIARLRIHVKENILHYCQAIWDYEQPDQRFFRLYNVDVPWIEVQEAPFMVDVGGRRGGSETFCLPSGDFPTFEVVTSLPISAFRRTTRKLAEVADLDDLLGYKGNYLIFPVRKDLEPSFLHRYMMQDYIDPRTGSLRDPDDFGNYTARELLDYICCIRETQLQVFEENRRCLESLVRERLATPRSESDIVIVPTDSLFIEALPGKHPILEDFKMVHRAIDVKKVQAEVRKAELENLRLAARLLEKEREDPDIEKQILIDGSPSISVKLE